MLMGAVLMVLVSACTTDTDPSTTVPDTPDTTESSDTTDSSDTTQSPDTTQATDTTAAADAADDSETPWWLLLLVLGAFLLLIVAFVARGSKKNVVVAPPPVSWKDNARSGYTDARWVYDAATEDLAVWRGNALSAGEDAAPTVAGSSFATNWQQLDGRVGKTSDELYAFEGSAPELRMGQIAGSTISSMRAVRLAVDARADARLNYRTVEAAGSTDTTALSNAREREVRSSRALAEARSAYGAALTDLSTLL